MCAEELELPDEIPGPESRAWGEKLGSCAGEKVYDALEEFRLDTEECRKSGEEVPEAPEKMPEGGN